MQQSNDLSFSADERWIILALADAMQADAHLDRPEPHPGLPCVHQLGEFAQIVVKPTEDDSEPAAFTIQTTGDPLNLTRENLVKVQGRRRVVVDRERARARAGLSEIDRFPTPLSDPSTI